MFLPRDSCTEIHKLNDKETETALYCLRGGHSQQAGVARMTARPSFNGEAETRRYGKHHADDNMAL